MDKLQEILDYNNTIQGGRQRKLYNYYVNKGVPVNSRQPVSLAKADSHTNLHIDFFKDIITLKVGYMGQKIVPVVNNKDERIEKKLKEFIRTNSLDVLNSESIKSSSISGLSHRLCYTENGIFKIKNIPGDQVVYDFTHTPLEPDAGYYYYNTTSITGEATLHCDVYDKNTVTYYEKNDRGVYLLKSEQPHNFKEVPLIPVKNSEDGTGDCDRVIDVMDVYDEVISDTSAEVKAMRLAYMLMYGNIYTGTDSEGNEIDINDWVRQTSTMRFPAGEDGKQIGGAEFLEKNINDTVIENILDRLRTHIYETSGSLDLKELISAERVFSIKASMMRLENTAKMSENYMRNTLYKQTRLWTYWMREFDGLQVTELDIDWVFGRVFPRDLAAEAGTIAQLTNTITLKDALITVGWDNAVEIAQRAEEEQTDLVNLEKDDDIQ